MSLEGFDYEKSRKKTRLFHIIMAVLIIGGIVSFFEEDTKKSNSNKSEYRISVPVASSWDSVAYCIKDYVKDNFNDGDAEYLEASLFMELSNGMFMQRVKVRAKNEFGAEVVENLCFFINGTGKDAKVVAVDNVDKVTKYLESKNITILESYDQDGNKK